MYDLQIVLWKEKVFTKLKSLIYMVNQPVNTLSWTTIAVLLYFSEHILNIIQLEITLNESSKSVDIL